MTAPTQPKQAPATQARQQSQKISHRLTAEQIRTVTAWRFAAIVREARERKAKRKAVAK